MFLPQTRSGRLYSPFAASPLASPESLDFAALLQAAFASASEEAPEELEVQGELPGELASEAQQSAVKRLGPPADDPPAKRTCPDRPGASAKPISRQHARRSRNRKAALLLAGQFAQARTVETHVRRAAPLITSLVTDDLPATSCGYHAAPSRLSDAQRPYTLSDLQRLGFELVAWDG
jgi:hypothetical protein